MNTEVTIYINGNPLQVEEGVILSSVLAEMGITEYHKSASGKPRGPLCGMGTCFECAVTVNDREHVRSCQTKCVSGMKVETR